MSTTALRTAKQVLNQAWDSPQPLDLELEHLAEGILRNYDRLDEEWRTELPLKRIWSLASEVSD